MGPGSSRRLDARHRQEQLPRRGTRTFPRCGLNGLRAGGPGSPGNDGFMSQPAIGLLLRIPRNCGSSRVFSAESGLARDCPAAGLSFVSRLGSSQDCCARDDPWVMIVCDVHRVDPANPAAAGRDDRPLRSRRGADRGRDDGARRPRSAATRPVTCRAGAVARATALKRSRRCAPGGSCGG